jgi:glycosyltransferase involved in cell wall biosynthesis
METSQPLVTIAIPTYNRERWLGRSIDSALHQNYANVELLVLDNASSDGTRAICERYASDNLRITYVRAAENLGSTANFSAGLDRASGHFFMWLGDDDWIDPTYVSACVAELRKDPSLALVSGGTNYYRAGEHINSGRCFELMQPTPWRRVVSYYRNVVDNSAFYGVMRTAQLRAIGIRNVRAWDWIVIANIAALGKLKVLSSVAVHRELGGASSDPKAIAESQRLRAFQARFPKSAVVANVWWDIFSAGVGFKQFRGVRRFVLATMSSLVVASRFGYVYAHAFARRVSKLFSVSWPGKSEQQG